MPFNQSAGRASRIAFACTLVLVSWLPLPLTGQQVGMVTAMIANEQAVAKQPPRFAYVSEERSTRTGGHLWKEEVVETDDGTLRKLVAVDGHSLLPPQAKAEESRIQELATHPQELRRQTQARREDEAHAVKMLDVLPKAFVFTPTGESDGCARFHFDPNPAFNPANTEEKIVAALAGTLTIKPGTNRLCAIDATVSRPVNIAFGLLGRVNQGGHLNLVRQQFSTGEWQITHISLHVDGRILIMKSISRDLEKNSAAIRLLPQHLSPAEAVRYMTP